MKVLGEYNNLMNKHSVEKCFIVATNALRIASNSSDIIRTIQKKYDLDVQIIDGNEEARLSFYGSVFPLNKNESKILIDIGGGSTEVVYGNSEELLFKNSFQIGVVSLTEKYFKSSPPNQNEIEEAENYANKVFSELSKAIPQKIEAVAVAGTPTTLSCIKQGIKHYIEDKVENSKLFYREVNYLLNEISPLSKIQMGEIYGQVVEGREDVLLAGTIILKTYMTILKLDEIIVSSKGLRYGVIIDYMLKESQ